MEHYDYFGDPSTMHDEHQKALGQSKSNKAIRIDKIPNEILKNANISTESLGSGLYAAY